MTLRNVDSRYMASLLDFINRVRTLQDLPAHPAVSLADTEPDDEEKCVLGHALGVPVGGSDAKGRDDKLVMRFNERLVARRVGIVMGLSWTPEPPEVDLPDALVDLTVAQHFGYVEADDIGFLRGWWVPEGPEDTQMCFYTPDDQLLPDADWVLPRRS